MVIGALHGDTITVQRRTVTGTDDYGNDVTEWTEHQIPRCNVQPVPRPTEVLGGTDQVTEQWRLFAPIGSDIRADDRVVYRGTAYQVDGQPQEYVTTIGVADHMEAYLKRWQG